MWSPQAHTDENPWFGVHVVDAETGRGIPLVALTCTNELRFYTDSQGYVAIQEPGLMDTRVFFAVESPGYVYSEEVFGAPGVVLSVEAGKVVTLEMERKQIAERLYRITGQGICRDSRLLARKTPLEQPVLNARVMGQDSVHATPYRDQIFWLWGDTSRPDFPLGNFQSTGAVSALPENGGLDPKEGVNLDYFTQDDGFVRKLAPIVADNAILVWLDALMTVPDAQGDEVLLAHYTNLRNLGEPIEHGLVTFDDDAGHFREGVAFELEEPWRYPQGQASRMQAGDTVYQLFPRPFPGVRVRASLEALKNPAAYEAFTCLEPGGRMNGAESPVLRDAEGQLDWGWRKDTDPVGQDEEAALVDAGLMAPEERRFALVDVESGEAVTLHRASFHFNDYLDRWIMIGCEIHGESFLGEIWFTTAPDATGPWGPAQRIATHGGYSFYNPTQHPFFDQDGGRYIYFEGTYTKMFSGIDYATPRYEYNQLMYRLDLGDPRLQALVGE